MANDIPPGIYHPQPPEPRDATPAELRADRLEDPARYGLCVTRAESDIHREAMFDLSQCRDCFDNETQSVAKVTARVLLTPPFRAVGGTVIDSACREVCKVDPLGMIRSPRVRAEMAIGIADALNAARGGVA